MNIQPFSPIFFMCAIFSCCCYGQYFTSPFHVDQLLNTERTIIDKLIAYIGRQKTSAVELNDSIKSFIKHADEKNRERLDWDRDLDTPLSTYHLIRRMVKGWEDVKDAMSCTEDDRCPIVTGEDVINNVLKKQEKGLTEKDLLTAALLIVNTQIVYDISVDEMARGEWLGSKDEPLSADDLFYIADTAKEAGRLYEAITWFEYLVDKLDNYPKHEFKTHTLLRRLAAAYHEYGVPTKAVHVLKNYLQKVPDDKKITRDLQYFEARAVGSKLTDVLRYQEDDPSKKTRQRKKYEQMCQRAIKNTYRPSNLTCSVVPVKNSYAVSKIEVLSQRPRIERIHDAINDDIIADIKEYANYTFGKSSSLIPSTEYPATSPQAVRSAALCEFNRFAYPSMDNVTRSLELLTKFKLFQEGSVASSLCFEVTNEGAGGYQRPVIDYRSQMQMINHSTSFFKAGNKVATIILQLSDVEKGGDIIFPRGNLFVPIVKGSAVIVYNLKESGLPDPRSLRINCPVIRGSKWTAHKHVFYTNQIFSHPCEAQYNV